MTGRKLLLVRVALLGALLGVAVGVGLLLAAPTDASYFRFPPPAVYCESDGLRVELGFEPTTGIVRLSLGGVKEIVVTPARLQIRLPVYVLPRGVKLSVIGGSFDSYVFQESHVCPAPHTW